MVGGGSVVVVAGTAVVGGDAVVGDALGAEGGAVDGVGGGAIVGAGVVSVITTVCDVVEGVATISATPSSPTRLTIPRIRKTTPAAASASGVYCEIPGSWDPNGQHRCPPGLIHPQTPSVVDQTTHIRSICDRSTRQRVCPDYTTGLHIGWRHSGIRGAGRLVPTSHSAQSRYRHLYPLTASGGLKLALMLTAILPSSSASFPPVITGLRGAKRRMALTSSRSTLVSFVGCHVVPSQYQIRWQTRAHFEHGHNYRQSDPRITGETRKRIGHVSWRKSRVSNRVYGMQLEREDESGSGIVDNVTCSASGLNHASIAYPNFRYHVDAGASGAALS